MPKMANENSQILLCVDDFTSFVVCIPLKDASSTEILKGIMNYIIQPFGIPTIKKSNKQTPFTIQKSFMILQKS